MPSLPPGPRAPRPWQTVAWVARPTDLLRRALARHGDPFTVRTLWTDAPLVLTAEPGAIAQLMHDTGGPLAAGSSSRILEPFAGPTSILVLDGDEHLRQRRLMLAGLRGEALARHRPAIAAIAHAELDRWRPGATIAAHPRMQAVTLDVILRVVVGSPAPALRDAIRAALDLTQSLPRLLGMVLVQRDLGPRSPYGRFLRAVGDVDALLYALIAARRGQPAGDEPALLDDLLAARHEDGTPPSDREVRDQLVTLLAAGHETTAAALAWALERLARHPAVLDWMRAGGREAARAVAQETLRIRPVLSIAPRRTREPYELLGHRLPAGVDVGACAYLLHRRADLYPPDPLAFRPQRWLDGSVADLPYAYLPFGGGRRRCLGAAFAMLEMEEVLLAVAQRVALAPERDAGERMRRRSVTLGPSRRARVRILAA